MTSPDSAPLVAHVINRFDVGGMENGLVNLINHLSRERYRHAVVSLTTSTDFKKRVTRDDVSYFSLNKKPGQDLGLHLRLWRLLRRLRPAIVHTRNLSTVEAAVPAAAAGVPCRVHGEHGRDIHDLDGTERKYQLLRRVTSPLIHRFVALSGDLESYLVDRVGIEAGKIHRIINGVDVERFHPTDDAVLPPESGFTRDHVVIGTVTRMQEVKDPVALVKAFGELVERGRVPTARLVMIGDGPLRAAVADEMRARRIEDRVWLAGARSDVPELLRAFDVFALSSKVEGISNTVLEAMASGLPVVATRVGGNDELIDNEVQGQLVPAGSIEALSRALETYAGDMDLARRHGQLARERAVREFGLPKMISRYEALYDSVLMENGCALAESASDPSETPCVG